MPIESRVRVEHHVSGGGLGGSADYVFKLTNSTGTRVTVETTFGAGVGAATSFTPPESARFLTIQMPSTNQSGWRLTGSTAEVGLPMSSAGLGLMCLQASTAPATLYGYSTSTRAISGVRIVYG